MDVGLELERADHRGTLAVTHAMLPLLRRSKSASIVNQSSSIGSLTPLADPEWVYAQVKPLGHAAKAALNSSS